MSEISKKKRSTRYRGRLAQLPIYIGKNFRKLIYQNDWKVIPMAAFMAALVAYVVKNNFYKTMEGTAMGALAVASVCMWNGFFNSIQVVCRERNIIKREHRSGMYISSYIMAHMVYQAFLCAVQTVTMIVVFLFAGIDFPSHGKIIDMFIIEFGITAFLISYAADMMSLFISCVVKTTTAAMTVMPLVLMIQLVFSGGLFKLPANVSGFSNLMISKQGIDCISAEADYNNLPSTSAWRLLKKVSSNPDIDPQIKTLITTMELTGGDKEINAEAAKANYKKQYRRTRENIMLKWQGLIVFALIFAFLAMFVLRFIDKDKR